MGKKQNFLFLCSDQHSRFEVGCYGNPVIKTPNIDALAADGTRFINAYSNNPICVPARAIMATGMYSFQCGCYDNATPYTGQFPSFGHRLQENGIPMTTIGKLHYKNAEVDTGFADQRIPLHVRDGVGDVYGLLRESRSTKPEVGLYPTKAKVGTSSYIEYDANVTEQALAYLEERRNTQEPWVCYVGYTLPHFPLVSPKETYDLYQEEEIPMPFAHTPDTWSMHQSCIDNRRYYCYDKGYSDEVIRHARHVYYGMCSYMDLQIGKVINKLKEIGQYENTVILYTTDHGDNAGNHGMWNKNNLLESSASIPMILVGDGIPKGKVSETPVSLVDIYPTILSSQDIPENEREQKLPGRSLIQVACQADEKDRPVFSEFHSTGSNTGGFMVRCGDFKYIYYVGYHPQLFNIAEDPEELHDLIDDPRYKETADKLDRVMRTIGNPEKINVMVKESQERILNEHGGREKVLADFTPVVYSPAPKV